MFLWKPFVFSSPLPFRRFGIVGLYKGLEAKLLQTVLTAALMFLVYEKLTAATFMVMGLKSTRKHWGTSQPPALGSAPDGGVIPLYLPLPLRSLPSLAWDASKGTYTCRVVASLTHYQLNFFDGWLSFGEEVGPMAIWKEHMIENLKMKLNGDLLIFLKGMDYCSHV